MSTTVLLYSSVALVIASLAVTGIWFVVTLVEKRLRAVDLDHGITFEIRP